MTVGPVALVPEPTESRHPVNQELIDHAPVGARVADRVTGFLRSWRFIAIQTVIVAIWIIGNVVLLFHFDPDPFILLTLAFSTALGVASEGRFTFGWLAGEEGFEPSIS